MGKCFCGIKSLYLCKPCNAALCKLHKILHEEDQQKEHIFEKLRRKLSSLELAQIAENLLSKISATNECRIRIIDETESLIAKIQSMCMQSLKKIKQKQQYYAALLGNCQKRLLNNQLKEISLKIDR